ncbi:hypothetical protein L0F63_003048, partial [Massospora cicadina]
CEIRALGILQSLKPGTIKFRERKYLLYAALYLVAVQEGRSITFRHFTEIDSRANGYIIGRIYKRLTSALKCNPPNQQPENLIVRILHALNENLNQVPDVASHIKGELEIGALAKVTDQLFVASKSAWISEGKHVTSVIAASVIIALQFHYNLTLTAQQVKQLIRLTGIGSSGYLRYSEIKKYILQALSLESEEDLVRPPLFYRFLPVLFNPSPQVEAETTNPCLLRTKACHERQSDLTEQAAQRLKSALSCGGTNSSSGLDPEILTRERALLYGIPYETAITRDVCPSTSRHPSFEESQLYLPRFAR